MIFEHDNFVHTDRTDERGFIRVLEIAPFYPCSSVQFVFIRVPKNALHPCSCRKMKRVQNPVETIQNRIERACEKCGRDAREITLIGASKTVSTARLGEFYDFGLQNVGENYVQEALNKQREIATSSTRYRFKWHFIGALQSNKAREVVGKFALIHSVDRIKLARALNDEARKIGVVQDVLLQVNIGEETSKSGCAPEDLMKLAREVSTLENLRVCGLMCLPPYFDDAEKVRPLFRQMRELRDELAIEITTETTTESTSSTRSLRLELSMGMSHDFEIAIEEGATMIRLGTVLFGARKPA